MCDIVSEHRLGTSPFADNESADGANQSLRSRAVRAREEGTSEGADSKIERKLPVFFTNEGRGVNESAEQGIGRTEKAMHP